MDNFNAIISFATLALGLSFVLLLAQKVKKKNSRPELFWDEKENLGFRHLADLPFGEELVIHRYTERGAPVVSSSDNSDEFFILLGVQSQSLRKGFPHLVEKGKMGKSVLVPVENTFVQFT